MRLTANPSLNPSSRSRHSDFGFVTPGNKKWYNPEHEAYPHDLAKARELLKEIGIEDRNGDGIREDADGHPIEFVLNTNTATMRGEKPRC